MYCSYCAKFIDFNIEAIWRELNALMRLLIRVPGLFRNYRVSDVGEFRANSCALFPPLMRLRVISALINDFRT